nr:MAG TPA: hypothetical protein [Caudoviricetes sp.]
MYVYIYISVLCCFLFFRDFCRFVGRCRKL